MPSSVSPLAAAEEVTAAGLVRTAARAQLRVLVADDSDLVRSMLARMLARHGITADEALDGLDAVAALGRADYDLLFLDLSMPNLDGHGVLRWMQSRPADAGRAPVVVVISSTALEEAEALAGFGVHRLMPKPLRRPELEQLLADLDPSH